MHTHTLAHSLRLRVLVVPLRTRRRDSRSLRTFLLTCTRAHIHLARCIRLQMGVVENIVATSLGNIIFGLLTPQPHCILGTTGVELAYAIAFMNLCVHWDVEYLPARVWQVGHLPAQPCPPLPSPALPCPARPALPSPALPSALRP